MREYGPSTYGDKIADVYDQMYADCDNDMIDRLVELAQNGSAFELGIGTGRVALPLSQRGVCVDGIDASDLMLKK